MYVINPDQYLKPHIGLSPFTTEHIAINRSIQVNDSSTAILNHKFNSTNWKFTRNGRSALFKSLSHYKLKSNDVVTVLTTSNNYYISSCVTNEIEKFCKWSREILEETKVILVNHEFGYPFENMDYIKSLSLPIIEDCCTTFFSQDLNSKIGKYGDFSIYSLPKFFPLQIGGILLSNLDQPLDVECLEEAEERYIINALSYYFESLDIKILGKRKKRFEQAAVWFKNLGFEERFTLNENVVPYALLLRNNHIIKDLNKLKIFLNDNGIQNSVFYGEDAFFIPNHQSLTDTDFEYICYAFDYFLKYSNR
ncbi:MAG: hypothetical protein RL638_219 [Bacteroidota bacterium]|jgi:dTDP-4-amino-4,6-dideoxygalactose transaminase